MIMSLILWIRNVILLQKNWQVERHPKSGNPTYKIPSALIIHREDQSFPLDHLIPNKNNTK